MGYFEALPTLNIGISKYITLFQTDPAIGTEHNGTSLSKQGNLKDRTLSPPAIVIRGSVFTL